MGKLTDLLIERGVIQEIESHETPQILAEEIFRLCDVFEEKNISQQIKDIFQEQQQTPLGRNKRLLFGKLPSIGEFFIPKSMNGRVLDCSEALFVEMQNAMPTLKAKAYAFDGHELSFIYYDSMSKSLQTGTFTEYPTDAYGVKMGRIGIYHNILFWISKVSDFI